MTIIKSVKSTLLTCRLCLGLIMGAFLTITPSFAVVMAQENLMDGFSEVGNTTAGLYDLVGTYYYAGVRISF